MIPILLVAGFLAFAFGAASQPGPVALACVVGTIGIGLALAGWWLEHVEGVDL